MLRPEVVTMGAEHERTDELSNDDAAFLRHARFGEGVEGAVDHYVAMTRATQHLVVLTSS